MVGQQHFGVAFCLHLHDRSAQYESRTLLQTAGDHPSGGTWTSGGASPLRRELGTKGM
jgi:hypothetical protein